MDPFRLRLPAQCRRPHGALPVPDLLTAVDEQRFLTLGRDARGRVLVVAYTWRGDAIRIFSARKATPRERREYREGER